MKKITLFMACVALVVMASSCAKIEINIKVPALKDNYPSKSQFKLALEDPYKGKKDPDTTTRFLISTGYAIGDDNIFLCREIYKNKPDGRYYGYPGPLTFYSAVDKHIKIEFGDSVHTAPLTFRTKVNDIIASNRFVVIRWHHNSVSPENNAFTIEDRSDTQ